MRRRSLEPKRTADQKLRTEVRVENLELDEMEKEKDDVN